MFLCTESDGGLSGGPRTQPSLTHSLDHRGLFQRVVQPVQHVEMKLISDFLELRDLDCAVV